MAGEGPPQAPLVPRTHALAGELEGAAGLAEGKELNDLEVMSGWVGGWGSSAGGWMGG